MSSRIPKQAIAERRIPLRDANVSFAVQEYEVPPRGEDHKGTVVFSCGWAEDQSVWGRIRGALTTTALQQGFGLRMLAFDHSYRGERHSVADRARRVASVLEYATENDNKVVVNGHSAGNVAGVMALADPGLLRYTRGLVAINPPGLSEVTAPPSRAEILHMLRREAVNGLGLERILERDVARAAAGIALNGLRLAVRGRPFAEGREILGTSVVNDFLELAGQDGFEASLVVGEGDALCPPTAISSKLKEKGYHGAFSSFPVGHSGTLIETPPVQYITAENLRILSGGSSPED